eukprot:CAMPEP_0185159208 /NCGR_PEP_ID=MMETSP1139-20130426/2905_1 /TAXON_ID=298111 /ORGANISM="Pavlova sp., Strain CCMP459" /LENGTH=34 /DNA_ID= /DNA_START= /DNA_END= /DNA_ORIENTATION=
MDGVTARRVGVLSRARVSPGGARAASRRGRSAAP